ncbi:MAG TPA: hypothetical protein VG293_01240 [Solirubrobacteraceae bacterium]|jgi:hypothetical protein|nr:hypothetical protein [Solirubrobacteraceae bacterium]
MLALTRRIAAVSLVLAGIAAGPVAAAQASDATLRTSLRRDLPRIKASQLKIRAASLRAQRTHSPSVLIRAIESQDRNLGSLRRRLRREPASSRSGRRGKADVVRGLTLIVDSNTVLARDLKRAAHHERVSKRRLAAATLSDRRGNRDLLRGAKLLKL